MHLFLEVSNCKVSFGFHATAVAVDYLSSASNVLLSCFPQSCEYPSILTLSPKLPNLHSSGIMLPDAFGVKTREESHCILSWGDDDIQWCHLGIQWPFCFTSDKGMVHPKTKNVLVFMLSQAFITFSVFSMEHKIYFEKCFFFFGPCNESELDQCFGPHWLSL